MNRRRIAFDLDNTLIANDFDFPQETPIRPFLGKIMGAESLRKGTIDILDFLQKYPSDKKVAFCAAISFYFSP